MESFIYNKNKYSFLRAISLTILTLTPLILSYGYAAPLVIPSYPLLGSGTTTTPNILILYDNSFSMEGQLSPNYYSFIGGNDPKSRSNIARTALRSILNSYKTKFNWGIQAFDIYGSKWNIDNNGRSGLYTGYEGKHNTMVFTNDCVNNRSWSNGGLKCIPNPEPNNGYKYITYEKGAVGDSAFLLHSYNKKWVWGTHAAGDTSGRYINTFDHHNSVTSWNIKDNNSTFFNYENDFKDASDGYGTNPHHWSGCIDSGSGDCVSKMLPRILWINDGWVFMKHHTGYGKIIEPILPESAPGHCTNLFNSLAPESPDLNSTEIKNGSLETPLMGSFITAKQYFSGTLKGTVSPIQNKCQKNYVLLATDGQPTASASGDIYSPEDLSNAYTGKAYTDLYPKIQTLRTTEFGGTYYDIKTFVLGMGDIVENPTAVKGLNLMAQRGGTDKAYLATDLASMMNSFQTIVDSISITIPLRESNGHIAISKPKDIKDTNLYKATFANPSRNIWQGNLLKSSPTYAISDGSVTYDTGAVTGFNTGAAKWLQNDKINGKPRQIITATRTSNTSPVKGTAFIWESLSDYTKELLIDKGEAATRGNQRVNYIRGDRSNEGATPDAFRKRETTVLGDIIDSSPVYVGGSFSGFSDSDFATGAPSFANFSENMSKRRPMIYVGANDGMLHGFDANTLQEVFAFIPNAVLSKLKLLSSQSYEHEFFVNETPLVTEAVVPGRGWITELIGFPGIGGTGLFALDISSPDKTKGYVDLSNAENNAANIVLWELNSQTDPDIGYILNRGQIGRNHSAVSLQFGKMFNNRWAILSGNGYNSPNNSTALVVAYLDAVGGKPSYKKVFAPGAKGGLSTPTPVDVDFDGIIDYAYAGDLQGNVWRFDLRGPEAGWKASLLFQAKFGKPSPITTAPAVMDHCAGKGLMVLVGTGKYIENTDNNPNYADNHADYLFGLWDKMDGKTIQAKDLVSQYYLQGNYQNSSSAPEVAKSLLLSTDNKVDWSGGKRGWMLQLYNQYPKASRIVVPPYVSEGKLYFNTISPNGGGCDASNSWGTSQALEACTGQRPQSGVFDTNYDGTVNNNDRYKLGGTPIHVTGINTKDLGRIIDTSTPINSKLFSCISKKCDSVNTDFNGIIGVKPVTPSLRRASWREIRGKQ